MYFCHSQKNYLKNMGKIFLDTSTKAGVNASKKAMHKAADTGAESCDDRIENKNL